MRVLIEKSVLLQAATRAASIVDKRNPMSSASKALLDVSAAGQLLVTAGDAVCTLVALYQVDVVSDQLRICVDAARLRDVASVLPSGMVTLTLRENLLEVAAGRSSFKLPTSPAEEFPIPQAPADKACSIQLDAATLGGLIRCVSHAIADDDNRYGLSGVHLEVPLGALAMVATDGSRLARVERPASHQGELPRRMMFPRRGLLELGRLIADVEGPVAMDVGARVAHVHWGGVASLYVRLLEADFPAYKEVLPKSYKHRFVVDRDVVGEALKRVRLAARDATKTVRFAFGTDSIVLNANQLDVMSCRDEVACEGDSGLSMGLSAEFLAEALAACPQGDVVLESGGALAPLLLKPRGDASALYVVMPVRID